jgi:hypothetical protein
MIGDKVFVEYELHCPTCNIQLVLSKTRFGIQYVPSVTCRVKDCSGRIGAHSDGRPLGSPADTKTRQARMRAHAAFDRIWEQHIMTRARAYVWMAKLFGISEAHIGNFNIDQCETLIKAVKTTYPALFPFELDDM